MILQVAFDTIGCVSQELIGPYINDPLVQFEFGTPIVNEYGYSSFTRAFPYVPTSKAYIDTKTIDFHEHELSRLRDCGFQRCSFLLGSELKALRMVADSDLFNDFEIWISTMGTPLRELRCEASEVSRLGYNYFIAHGHGVDLADAFADMMQRFEILHSITGTKIILAGGITLSHMRQMRAINPHAIIVGRSITNAIDPSAGLKDFRNALSE